MSGRSGVPERSVVRGVGGGPGNSGRSPFSRLSPVVGVLALAVLLTGCGASGGGDSAAGGSGTDSPGDSADQEAPLRFNITDLGYNEGDPNAPIRVAEFSDFACPHCREFHAQSFPSVREEWVETGTVLWKYIPFVLGVFPNSLEAARAGECAIEQDAFPPMRDRIFEEQPDWLEVEDPRDLFIGYAEDEGLDVDQFTSCLEEGRRDEQLQRNIEVGQQIGIRGTPTFMVDGVPIQGNRSPEVFGDIFSQMLDERGLPVPGGADGDDR